VTVGQTVLAPGEETTVTVTKTVRVSGPFSETITLHTDDPANPVVYFTLHGDVPHDLIILPDRVYIAGVRGEAPTRTLRLLGPETAAIIGVSSRDSCFAVETAPVPAPWEGQKAWDVTLTAGPDLPAGSTEDELRIETTHAARPLITVPVAIDVQPQIRRLPPKLFFGFVQPGETAGRTLTLRSFDGRAFRVTAATCEAAGVSAALEQAAPDRWLVRVAVNRAEPGVIDTTLVLTTDLPGEERIEVPLYADVRATP